MKQRTAAYVFTADVNSVADMQQIEVVRKTVLAVNRRNRQASKWSGKEPEIFRVTLKARLGKNNPAYAAKYKQQWIKSIKLEDAQRIDVYIQRRYN